MIIQKPQPELKTITLRDLDVGFDGQDVKLLTLYPLASVAANALLLYDSLFDVAKTMNSTATVAVTGVPTIFSFSGG